jgi:glycosyltransferase involved in cell wall biosynthesis
MRIAHIEGGRHLYGGPTQVLYLLDGLRARGVENVLVCAAGGELEQAARGLADIVALPMRGALDLGLVGRVRRVLTDVRLDLAHVHSRRGADVWGGIAAARAHVPAVVTRRVDSWEPSVVAKLKYGPYRRVVALSRAIDSRLRASGVAPERIVRIPSAVDGTRYRPDPEARARIRSVFRFPDDVLVVGVVAQLIARKGHARLFRALPELVRREQRLRVLCFGRGPLESRLRKLIRDFGLEGNVLFAGFRPDLPALLPGLDVLVHPAEREGLGVAVLEAGSCGVAVVATSVGGVRDILEHARTGWLVDPDDAALAAGLSRLLTDAKLRAQLGAAARAAMLERFSVDAMVDAHLNLYNDVLGRSGTDRAVRPPAVDAPRSDRMHVRNSDGGSSPERASATFERQRRAAG